MCGVYGFIGTRPDLAKLHHVAELASRRGPHAHGIAWRDPSGAIVIDKIAASYRASKHIIERARHAAAIIGHARLATSGSVMDLDNDQPLRAGAGAIAHNGTVPDACRLAEEFGVGDLLTSENDSEALGWIIERRGGELTGLEDVMRAIRSHDRPPPCVLLSLWPHDGPRIGVIRDRHPLWIWSQPEGRYLCSLRPDPAADQVSSPSIALLGQDY